MPPAKEPSAQPVAKVAMSMAAVKSVKPSSCSHMVKKTMAFQGVLPTMPCSHARTMTTWLHLVMCQEQR